MDELEQVEKDIENALLRFKRRFNGNVPGTVVITDAHGLDVQLNAFIDFVLGKFGATEEDKQEWLLFWRKRELQAINTVYDDMIKLTATPQIVRVNPDGSQLN